MENPTQGRLSGQVALITGASAGIGLATTRAFLREGADLVIVARNEERLQKVATEAQKIGRQCIIVVGDVREEETATLAIKLAMQQFGRLDILINNAGVAVYGNLAEINVSDYDVMMDTNMRGPFLFAHKAVPIMIKRGSGTIINVASVAGVLGLPSEAVYCATKFALRGFSQALDRELRPYGIRIGVICPGDLKTGFGGRRQEEIDTSGYLDTKDVADSILLMATQPSQSRIMEIRMRPMIEPFSGRDPD